MLSHNKDKKEIPEIRTYCSAVFLFLMVLMIMLSGCLTPRPGASLSEQPADSLPAVPESEDAGLGFVITETARLEEPVRMDFEKAVLLMEEGAYDKAVEILEGIIEKTPGVTAPYIDLGIAYQQAGNPERAEEQFKNALELFPGHPVASNQYGLLLRSKGKFDEARDIFEQALGEYPSYYPVHRNLGILYDLYLNDLAKALEHYEIYMGYVPQDDRVKIWIADLRIRLGLAQ